MVGVEKKELQLTPRRETSGRKMARSLSYPSMMLMGFNTNVEQTFKVNANLSFCKMWLSNNVPIFTNQMHFPLKSTFRKSWVSTTKIHPLFNVNYRRLAISVFLNSNKRAEPELLDSCSALLQILLREFSSAMTWRTEAFDRTFPGPQLGPSDGCMRDHVARPTTSAFSLGQPSRRPDTLQLTEDFSQSHSLVRWFICQAFI